MNRYWDKPIIVTGSDGKLTTIRSAEEAAAFILDRWPHEINEHMLQPLEKLIDVIDGGVCPEVARSEFLIAIHHITHLHS